MISKYAVLFLILLLVAACRQSLDLRDNIEDFLQTASVQLTDSADENGFSTENITVELSCEDSEAEIWYTTDRSTPGDGSGDLYTGPIVLSGHNTPIVFKAVAVKKDSLDSEVVSRDYLIVYDSVADPVFSIPGGSYASDRSIGISCSLASAVIWYTTDGTSPKTSSSRIQYSSPILLNQNGTTLVINSYAAQEGIPDSHITAASYTLQYDKLAAPVFSPPPGQQESLLTVLLSSATSGADIRYTVDGTNPVTSGSALLYTGGITLNWAGYTERTIRAAAVAPQMEASEISIGYYYLQQGKSSTPSLSSHASHVPYGSDIYSGAASLDLHFESPDDSPHIFYTLDNTVPMVEQEITGSGDSATVSYNILNGSTHRYNASSPSSVSAETTHIIKAIAFSGIKSASSVYTQNLILDRTAPTVSTPDLLAAHDSGSSSSDNLSNYSGAFQLNATVDATATVELLQGGSPVSTRNDVSGGFSFSRTLTSDGSYSFSCRATDIVGNTALSPGTLTLTVDRTPPGVSMPDLAASDDQGTSNIDNITNQTSGLTFTGTAETGAAVDLLVNSTGQASGTAPGGAYTFDGISILTEGLKSVQVRATDAAGNSATSSSLSMTVDTTAPSAPTVSTAPHTTDTTPAFSWNAPSTAVRYGYSATSSSGPFTVTGATSHSSSTYTPGNRSFYVRAGDTAGNWSSAASANFRLYGWQDNFEDNAEYGSQLLGGRTTDTVGAGQGGVTIANTNTLETFGINLTSPFGQSVTLQLDIRDISGVSVWSGTLPVGPSTTGWVYWTNIGYTSSTNNKFIFTVFVRNTVASGVNSGIRAGVNTGATHPGTAYNCTETTDAAMNVWGNWVAKPADWDFWFRAYGD